MCEVGDGALVVGGGEWSGQDGAVAVCGVDEWVERVAGMVWRKGGREGEEKGRNVCLHVLRMLFLTTLSSFVRILCTNK